MKPSILKKLNLIIEEANTLKDKNKFQKAIDKFEQALNFINIKVDEPSDKRIEIENIRNAMNQTYSVEINYVIQEAIQLTAQKEFNQARTCFQKALKICEKIDDKDLKDAEKSEINELISEIDIQELLIKGIKLREEEKEFDEAIRVFNQGITIVEKIQDSDGKKDHLSNIKEEIENTYKAQFKQILQQGIELKQAGQFEEAIKLFEKTKRYIEDAFPSDTNKNEIVDIKNMSNEIYSNQIKPIVEKANELLTQGSVEEGISELKDALMIIGKMYDSDLKDLEISLIAELMNPIYIERIKIILDEGIEITKKENFKESNTLINQAVDVFESALDIAKTMINSERKDLEIKKICDSINQACLTGINTVKDKAIQLIGQQKHEEAINEVYIALSLAKRMTYPEEENEKLEELKNLVNKVYSVEIKKVIDQGNELVVKKEFEKAIKVFNEALQRTDKMYFTKEMEKQVNIIKSLIYDAEVGLLVGEGKLTEEQQAKEKEIEKLQKRLDYAKSIEDDKRRVEEMNKIKKLIDDIHSEEIKLLIEQGNQLADKKTFGEAFKFYEKALKVNEMMEEPDIKNKDLIKESYKRELINKAKIEIENEQYDVAIENGRKAVDLDERFVDGYHYIGVAYNYKKKYDAAIENLKKALDYDKNHIESWNLIGLAYEAKNEYENALEFLTKAIEIDPSYSNGWYNLGNIYKQKNEFDKAIESYTRATEIDPKFAKAWFFMGSTYFDKKDYNNAIINLEKSIQIDPNLANLAQEINPIIKDLKNIIDKLQEALKFSFINR
ncbi:MAG: tetratricopeptide repeat protein [Candidatus Hodarchaeota archaeon]